MPNEAMTGTLYELSEAITRGMKAVEAAETEEDRDAALLALQPILEAEVRKADSYAHYMAVYESVSALAAAELKRLQARKRRADTRLDWLKSNAQRVMELNNWTEIAGETCTIVLQGCAKSLSIYAVDLIPDKYRTLIPETTEIDTVAVKAALKANVEVPGATLVGGKVVRVK